MASQVTPAPLPPDPLVDRLRMHFRHWWARKRVSRIEPALNRIKTWNSRRVALQVRRIAAEQKCYGCGNYGAKMRWANELGWNDGKKGGIVFRCDHCGAIFAQRPVFSTDIWRIQDADALAYLFEEKPVIPKIIAASEVPGAAISARSFGERVD